MGKLTAAVRVADEVWIATALLHREHPQAADFSVKEIVVRLEREGLTDRARPGVNPHLSSQAVANRRPDPGRYRMLVATPAGRRRLFRPGDPYDAGREGGKTHPNRDDVPPKYHRLIDWYEREWVAARESDPLLEIGDRYRSLWKDVNADAYVRRLREGWK